MTVPTVVFLLVGGVLSDRHDRRLLMLWSDVVRAGAVACLAGARLRGRAAAVAARRPGRALRLRHGVLHPGVRGDRPRPAAERTTSPPPTRSTSSCARSRFGSLGPLLGGWLVAVGAGLAFAVDAASFGASAVAVLDAAATSTRQLEHGSHGAAVREGLVVHPPPRLALGDARRRGRGLPRLPRARARCCSRTWSRTSCTPRPRDLGLVFAAGGVGAIGAARLDGPARASAPRRDRHVRDVDARDVGDRRLRPRHSGVAADGSPA